MDGEGDALTYKLNNTFTVKFDVVKGTDGKATVDVYIDGTKLSQTKYTMGGTNQWSYGIRFFDAACDVDLDNIKVVIDEENEGDIHTGAWKDVSLVYSKVEGNVNGLVAAEKCNRCGEIISKTYPNVVYDGVDSVGIKLGGTNADSIPATDTTEEVICRTYHEDISGAWNTIKTAPYTINFSLVDVTEIASNSSIPDNGVSLITWRNNGTGFEQPLRLFDNGELRMKNHVGSFTASSSSFRFTGTEADPGNYEFHIVVDPTYGQYDVYIDDLDDAEPMFYFGTEFHSALSAAIGSAPKIRIGDGTCATLRIKNFSITHNVEAADHNHTAAFADADDKAVIVGYDTLNPALNCYCGEAIPQGNVTEVLVKTNNVYYGISSINNIPTEGEFWIATDVNIRSEEVLKNLVDYADSVAFSLGTVPVYLPDDAIAPVTYQYAMKVSYVEAGYADIEIYIDGKLVQTYEHKDMGDYAGELNLGNTNSTDLRFNYTKIVKLGEGEAVEITYNDATDKTLPPCFHAEKAGTIEFTTIPGKTYESGNVKAVKKLVKTYICANCGEKVAVEQGDVLGLNPDVDSTFILNENASTDGHLTAGNRGLNPVLADISSDAGAYWLYFDLHTEFTAQQIANVNARPNGSSLLAIRVPMIDISAKQSGDPRYANIDDKNFWGGGASDTFAYVHLLRAFPDERTDGIGARFYWGGTTNQIFFENGKTYSIAYRIETTDKAVNYQVYVDNELVFERSDTGTAAIMALQSDRGDLELLATKKTSRYPYFRFIEQGTNWGNFSFSNVSLVREDDGHTHTDEWAQSKGVSVTRDELGYYDECYCGEKILGAQIDSIIYDNIQHIHGGSAEFDRPDGEFWIAADYGVSADAEEPQASISIDGVTIVSITGKELWGQEKLMDVNVPDAYSIAVRFIDDTSYELYINGHLAASYTGVPNIAGDTIYINARDSKLTNIKIVTLGETDEPLVPKYSVDETVRPCYHSKDLINTLGRNYDGTLSLICSACGEKIENSFKDDAVLESGDGKVKEVFSEGASYTMAAGNSAFRYMNLPADFIGEDAAPYQIDFTLTLDTMIDPANLANVSTSGDYNTGRNIFNSDLVYNALVRQFPAYDENGDFYTDRIEIRSGSSANSLYLTTMMLGDTVQFSIRFNPATNEAHIYINGEYVLTRVDGYKNDKTKFRFSDGVGNTFTISDVRLIKDITATDEHTHTDRYLNADEMAASTVEFKDNKVVYSFDCYCGETVSYGIGEVILDKIAPEYGLKGTKTVIESALLDEEGYALVGSFAVRALPEAMSSVIRLGDYDVIGVDADGKLYAFGNATDIPVEADKAYHSYALVRFASGEYNLYVDGAYVGTLEDGDGTYSVSVGADEGEYHFEAMAIVALAADGDLAYAVDTTSHSHTFDPLTAELVFSDNNTAITIEYVCTSCDREAVDGITKNLYDDEATLEIESIPPVIDSVEALRYEYPINEIRKDGGEGSFWFSFDVALKEAGKKNVQNVLQVGDVSCVTVDVDGTLKLADHSTVGKLTSDFTNITVFVDINGDITVAYVYVDGKYCAAFETEFDGYIYVGNDDSIIDFKAIKLMEIGNGGTLHIGDYVCPDGYHTIDYEKATVNYLDVNKFEYVYRCTMCGKTIVEKAVHSFYDETIPHIYEGYGQVPFANNDTITENPTQYWMIADVNVRDYSIGRFDGYKNLIGESGESVVLVNDMGNLILGDGTKLDVTLSGKYTYNIAVMCENIYDYETDTSELSYHVYVNGKYAGKTTGELKYEYEHDYSLGYEYFGDQALKNIRFYNIKSVSLLPEGEEVKFDYKADLNYIPCYHSHDAIFGEPAKTIIGEYPMTIYFCEKCGERVTELQNADRYDRNLNANTATDFVLDANNSFYAQATGNYNRVLNGDASTMGKNAGNYWIMFDITPELINANNIGASNNNSGKGRNLVNFGTQYNSPLRLFAIEDGNNGYVADKVYVRSGNEASYPVIATLEVGKTTSFWLFANPKSQTVDIYVDGEFVTSRSSALVNTQYTIRFFDGAWGKYQFDNFKFIGAATHEHTARYSEQLGGEDILVYGETTLAHRYTCYCGEVINAGIDKVLLDKIATLNEITEATALSDKAIVTPKNNTYWLSAKVSTASSVNVFSYGDLYMVETTGGYYRIGGAEAEVSNIKVSADYDIVSVNIDAANDIYHVYINGKYIGTGYNVDFTPGEDFNVKLGGGGAAATFENIKLVTLADGKAGKVVLPIEGCGNHEFDANRTKAVIKDDGIEFICINCGTHVVRKVAIGNATVHTNSGFESKNSAQTKALTANEFSDIVDPANGGNFYFTFSLTPTDLSNLGDGGKSLFTWIPNSNENWASNVDTQEWKYVQIFRIFKDADGNAELRLTTGNNAGNVYNELPLKPTMVANTTYKFIIEVDPTTQDFFVYMSNVGEDASPDNLIYVGEGNLIKAAGSEELINSKYKSYGYRFVDAQTGTWTLADLKLFRPQTVTDNVTGGGSGEAATEHIHTPKIADGVVNKVTYGDGVITHEFTCSDTSCGKHVVLTNVISKLDSDKLDVESVTRSAKVAVGQAMSKDADPYWFSVDISADIINVDFVSYATYSRNADGSVKYDEDDNPVYGIGRSIISLEGPENTRIHLARAFGHVYVEGEGYEDKNQDGFADGVIDLKVNADYNSKLIA
ncbi:MAG: hypothetical protein IJW79_10345, partial [Clostridia bacterium]|nr:hypothetical protein [Clostridia bacterium]